MIRVRSSSDAIAAKFSLPSYCRWIIFSASSNWRPVDSSLVPPISLSSQRWRWFVDWWHSCRVSLQFLSIPMVISTTGSKRRLRGFWQCWETWLTWRRSRFQCACYYVGCWVNLRSSRQYFDFLLVIVSFVFLVGAFIFGLGAYAWFLFIEGVETVSWDHQSAESNFKNLFMALQQNSNKLRHALRISWAHLIVILISNLPLIVNMKFMPYDLVKVYGVVIVYSLWRKFKDEEEQRNAQKPWLLWPADCFEINRDARKSFLLHIKCLNRKYI